MPILLAAAAALLPPVTVPAPGPDLPPRITVSGQGVVFTPPDRATVDYTVRGEGPTSDAAVAALVATRRKVEGDLAALAQAVTVRTGKVTVREVRDPRCKSDDDDAPRLSAGACAVVGYVAEIAASVETGAVAQAGTMVSAIARAGGVNPRLEDFSLADPHDAERRAIAAAIADGRRKAVAVASGAGARLGALVSVNADPDRARVDDVIVTGSRLPAPVLASPPIAIDVSPMPVETRAEVSITYAIAS